MIQTMPILISSLFPFAAKGIDSNAKTAIENARTAFAAAETEMNFGDAAAEIIAKSAGERQAYLAEIAAWHYSKSVVQFRQALGKFEMAGRNTMPAKYSRYIQSKKAECLNRANKAFSKKSSVEKLAGE